MKKTFFRVLLKAYVALSVLPGMMADAVREAFEGETVEVSMDTQKKSKPYTYKKVSS